MAKWGALSLSLLQMKTQELTVRNLLSRTGTRSPKLALPPSFSFLSHHSAPRQSNKVHSACIRSLCSEARALLLVGSAVLLVELYAVHHSGA